MNISEYVLEGLQNRSILDAAIEKVLAVLENAQWNIRFSQYAGGDVLWHITAPQHAFAVDINPNDFRRDEQATLNHALAQWCRSYYAFQTGEDRKYFNREETRHAMSVSLTGRKVASSLQKQLQRWCRTPENTMIRQAFRAV